MTHPTPDTPQIHCNQCREIQWEVDDAHGWLRVPKALFFLSKTLPSAYSYHDQDFVYLEEDADATLFLDWMIGKGWADRDTQTIHIHQEGIPATHTDGMSPIREMARMGEPVLKEARS
jgi:hypothetical protein